MLVTAAAGALGLATVDLAANAFGAKVGCHDNVILNIDSYILVKSRTSALAVSVDAVNSEHGRHFELVADGRLRASDKITLRGEGVGTGEHAG